MTEQTRCYCRSCGSNTNHKILASHKESSREDYSFDQTYQIVQCLGCETKSFRDVYEDIESAYQIDHDEWEIPTTVNVYPKFIVGHRDLDDFYLPDLVDRIYQETVLALKENAGILAGLGLRGTVEAVCNDLNITGRNLEVRISKLATAGFISRRDAARLHGIRFMGNDAAHEIKKPKREQLDVALKIVEHLLSSVYILEQQIENKIETSILDFSKFIKLLTDKIKSFNPGDEIPLLAILGKDIRRISESVIDFEKELKEKITAGEIDILSIGKISKFNESKNELQHYIVK